MIDRSKSNKTACRDSLGASLGHTGRGLCASTGTQAICGLVVIGALTPSLRVTSSGMGRTAAGVAWAAAFGGFPLLYGKPLCSARLVAG
jgi:uncharacterized protein involved in response to NO